LVYEDIATKVGSQDMLKEALALINVVPNPYYAFSEYERTRLDTEVKIVNLPEHLYRAYLHRKW